MVAKLAAYKCPTCGLMTVQQFYGPCASCRARMNERATALGMRNKIAKAVRDNEEKRAEHG